MDIKNALKSKMYGEHATDEAIMKGLLRIIKYNDAVNNGGLMAGYMTDLVGVRGLQAELWLRGINKDSFLEWVEKQ